MVNEYQLQQFWQSDYCRNAHLQTLCGQSVRVEHPGIHNRNQGPDFINADLRIDRIRWVGNIEIHCRTSDWFRHHHQYDTLYSSIVLHVVWENDDHHFYGAPVLVLSHFFTHEVIVRYSEQAEWNLMDRLSGAHVTEWARKRLKRKLDLFHQTNATESFGAGALFWSSLFRSMGGPVNAEAFYALQGAMPVVCFGLNTLSHQVMESMLFGLSRLLIPHSKELYPRTLNHLYGICLREFKLKPIFESMYFLRMRPMGFPTVRLAQLSSVMHHHVSLPDQAIESHLHELEWLFQQVKTTGYWDNHFLFDKPTEKIPKILGPAVIQRIMINTIFPWRSMIKSNGEVATTLKLWEDMLVQCSAESNGVIDWMNKWGAHPKNAFESQGLLEVYRSFSYSN